MGYRNVRGKIVLLVTVLSSQIFSSVTSARNEGISKMLDDVFDASYNKSIIEGDLPDVRWGRIDYLNVTGLTTKWNVWQYVFVLV